MSRVKYVINRENSSRVNISRMLHQTADLMREDRGCTASTSCGDSYYLPSGIFHINPWFHAIAVAWNLGLMWKIPTTASHLLLPLSLNHKLFLSAKCCCFYTFLSPTACNGYGRLLTSCLSVVISYAWIHLYRAFKLDSIMKVSERLWQLDSTRK